MRLCWLLILTAGMAGRSLPDLPRRSADRSLGRLPLTFEPGRQPGQFLSHCAGFTLLLDGKGAAIASGESVVARLAFNGARPGVKPDGAGRLDSVSNYLIGRDPAKWRANVPNFSSVRYAEIYDGIDLVYYGNHRNLEFDFVVRPGADPTVIRLAYEGAAGIRIDPRGDLVLDVPGGRLVQHAPRAYQNGETISARYMLNGTEVRIVLGDYDSQLPLVIDPILTYASFLGGSNFELAAGVTVDALGNGYITGSTMSTDFPVLNPLPGQATSHGNWEVFVTKVNPAGTGLVYSTYLGGSDIDLGYGVAVDSNQNVYLTGVTQSLDFPASNSRNGQAHSFIAKLNSAGSALLFSLLVGGSGPNNEIAGYITLDGSGNAYVSGLTASARSELPVVTAQFGPLGGVDAFVAKLSPAGAFQYFVLLGGKADDSANSIALDSMGRAYVTGSTASKDFPTHGGVQPTNAGGATDAFVAILNATGQGLDYSTYLGGTGGDNGVGIAVDAQSNVYVAGITSSGDYPVKNAFQSEFGGGFEDAFVTKLNPSLGLIYSTYLGGEGPDEAKGLALDGAGNVFVGGLTSSPNFPSASASPTGSPDGFVVKLDANGSFGAAKPLFTMFIGGTGNPYVTAFAVDSKNNFYLAGFAGALDPGLSSFPPSATPPFRNYGGGFSDAFIAKLSNANIRTITTTPPRRPAAPVAGSNVAFGLQIVNQGGSDTADNVAVSGNLPAALTLVSCTANGVSCGAPGGSTVYGVLAPSLAAGGSIDVAITVRINSTLPAGTVIPLHLRGRSDTNDPDETDNETVVGIAAGATGVCSYVLNRNAVTAGAGGDQGRVDVATTASCNWSAISNAGWITVSPASPLTGSGSFHYIVAPNVSPSPRAGQLTIGSQTFQITQAGAGCAFTLTASSGVLDAAGGAASASVTGTPGCGWTAVAGTNWISFPSGPAGTGSGTLPITFSANTGASPRTASISVAGQTVQLVQNGINPVQAFTDVPLTHPYFDQIALLKQYAITLGCSATTFCPDATTTRGQMAAFITRGRLGIAAGTPFPYPAAQYFTDVPTTHPFYAEAQKMRELGITVGCSATQYCPDAPNTRGQMAVFIIRAFFTP